MRLVSTIEGKSKLLFTPRKNVIIAFLLFQIFASLCLSTVIINVVVKNDFLYSFFYVNLFLILLLMFNKAIDILLSKSVITSNSLGVTYCNFGKYQYVKFGSISLVKSILIKGNLRTTVIEHRDGRNLTIDHDYWAPTNSLDESLDVLKKSGVENQVVELDSNHS